MTHAIDRSIRWLSIALGASGSSLSGLGMAKTFEYAQAEEIRDAFARHGVRYLFLGKSGAILLGYPDTTQDADLFVEKSPTNGAAIVAGLVELGFELTDAEHAEIRLLIHADALIGLEFEPGEPTFLMCSPKFSRGCRIQAPTTRPRFDSGQPSQRIAENAQRNQIWLQ